MTYKQYLQKFGMKRGEYDPDTLLSGFEEEFDIPGILSLGMMPYIDETMLDRIGVTRVDIMMDPDTAGHIASEKIAKLLDTRNIYSRIIKVPVGKDPGSISQTEAKEALV